ncbi:hypothetical protein [Streptomyces sp. H39-S7]|uniref:hypothetical protein n=1 Tax=Streptomyces sp. H39-S7 TaxID=3004357 RepID=UPI0022AEE0FE|nr:hypothetical protein [Streptomyces sp. H39-S7]MCZ4119916.1 hypothetical protein [Streptomyces sp. H39-S7]
MPRRRPGALRAEHPAPPVWGPWTDRIPGLSERTCAEIQRVEREHDDSWPGLWDGLWDGAVEAALRNYRAFLRQPGRFLDLCFAVSPHPGSSLVDMANARDILREALHALPQPSRAELGRVVAGLDAELRRRTLPDPLAHRRLWWHGAWWHRRLYDGEFRW